MADHFIVLAAEPCIRLIGIGNNISRLGTLSGPKFLGLMTDHSFADPFCRFDQQASQMCVTCFGYTEPVYVF